MKRIGLTFFTTGIAMLLSLLISFFITPFISTSLGVEAYGYIQLCNTFVTYVAVFSTALNSYSTRYVAVEYHQNNYIKASEYLSTVFFSNLIFSLIVILITVFFLPYIPHLLSIDSSFIVDVDALLVCCLISFLFTNLSTCFSSSVYIKNRLDLFGVLQILSYLFECIVLLALYLLFKPWISYYGVGLISSAAILFFGNLYLFKKLTPNLIIDFNHIKISCFKDLLYNGIWNSLNSLGNVLNTGLDLLVSNILIGPIASGQIAVSKTFTTLFGRMFQLLSQPFQPNMLKSYSYGDSSTLVKWFSISVKVCGIFSIVLVSTFIAIGEVFYMLWIPDQDVHLIYLLTVIALVSFVAEGPVYPLYYVYTLTVKNRIPCFVTILGGLANVFGMIVLINYSTLGVYSIPLTTLVVMSFINVVFNPLYMAKCLNIQVRVLYKPLIRVLLSSPFVMCLAILLSNTFYIESWYQFVFVGLIIAFFGALISSFLVMNFQERQLIIRSFKRIINR